MPALETPSAKTGTDAPAFSLPATDGKTYSLEQLHGPEGLLVMFICNHCPYVKAVIDRVVSDAKELQAAGFGVVAIMSNDVTQYPADSFENMKKFASEKGFTFPYLLDETQDVARAYGAVCTPDFFAYNAGLKLQYRGRLDESWQMIVPDPKRELLMACREIVASGKTGAPQHASIGCSIKWKQ